VFPVVHQFLFTVLWHLRALPSEEQLQVRELDVCLIRMLTFSLVRTVFSYFTDIVSLFSQKSHVVHSVSISNHPNNWIKIWNPTR